MNIDRQGSGTPVVLVPGIQGRWEWMQPAVDALSTRCASSRSRSPMRPDERRVFDDAVGLRLLRASRSKTHWTRLACQSAVICGISYGGLIAATFAARHPDRVRGVGARLGDSTVVETGRAGRVPTCERRGCCHRSSASTHSGCSGNGRGPRRSTWRPRSRSPLDTSPRSISNRFSPTSDGATRPATGAVQLEGRADVRFACRRSSSPGRPALDRVVPVH